MRRGIPADHVAVEAFYSPECDPTGTGDKFTPNAWRIEQARDGIIGCALPSYKVSGPLVNDLLQCYPIYEPRCGTRADGLPNATVLKSALECAKAGGDNIRVECKETKGLIAGEHGYAVAEVNSADCPKAFDNELNVLEFNAWVIVYYPSSLHDVLIPSCADENNLAMDDLVVRRFHTSRCPERGMNGRYIALNGWLISHNRLVNAGELTICSSFSPLSLRVRGDRYFGYKEPTKHADECGGASKELNAYVVSLNEGRLPSAEAPFLNGSWRLSPGMEIWQFELVDIGLKTQKLKIRRSDGRGTGIFVMDGLIGWKGDIQWPYQRRFGGEISSQTGVILRPSDDCRRIETNLKNSSFTR